MAPGSLTDVQRHPILAGIESLQIHKYLGSEWVFGSAKDADDVDGAASALALEELAASSNISSSKEVVKAVVNATMLALSKANSTIVR